MNRFCCSFKIIRAPLCWDRLRQACDDALRRDAAFVLILNGGEANAASTVLSPSEQRRWSLMQREQDRSNFVLGRTLVHLLVRPIGAGNSRPVMLASDGKPYIIGAPSFNLSHSGSYVGCVVSNMAMVGIDLECLKSINDWRSMLPLIAHPAELHAINAQLPEQQFAWFRRCWTRKEAILKALGTGLIDGLPRIDTYLSVVRPMLTAPAALRVIDVFRYDAEAAAAIAVHASVQELVIYLCASDGNTFSGIHLEHFDTAIGIET